MDKIYIPKKIAERISEEKENVKSKKYKIVKILDKKTQNGQTQYLVQWKNHPVLKITWEFSKNIKNFNEFSESKNEKNKKEIDLIISEDFKFNNSSKQNQKEKNDVFKKNFIISEDFILNNSSKKKQNKKNYNLEKNLIIEEYKSNNSVIEKNLNYKNKRNFNIYLEQPKERKKFKNSFSEIDSKNFLIPSLIKIPKSSKQIKIKSNIKNIKKINSDGFKSSYIKKDTSNKLKISHNESFLNLTLFEKDTKSPKNKNNLLYLDNVKSLKMKLKLDLKKSKKILSHFRKNGDIFFLVDFDCIDLNAFYKNTYFSYEELNLLHPIILMNYMKNYLFTQSE